MMVDKAPRGTAIISRRENISEMTRSFADHVWLMDQVLGVTVMAFMAVESAMAMPRVIIIRRCKAENIDFGLRLETAALLRPVTGPH